MSKMSTTETEADRRALLHRMIGSGEAARIRKASGLRLSEVARSVGTDHTTVSRWERGERRPRSEQGLAYLELLLRLRAA